MGYIQMRHILDWGEISQFKSFAVKYNKYFKLNLQNLKTCKAKALTDNNYDQIENFIEYYTSDDEERKAIKECAYDYVIEDHCNELEELI